MGESTRDGRVFFEAGPAGLHPRLKMTPKTTKLAGMKFNITIDRDEDGAWVTSCPSIPGCHSQGKTRQEAITSIQEAIGLCLEVRAERGLPLTVETYRL
jgi:predicted RNase H-like HicB family nuclease